MSTSNCQVFSKMRILFVIKGLGVGGAEKLLFNASRWLLNCGHVVELVNLNPALSEMESEFVEAGVKVYRCPLFSFGLTKAIWQFTKILINGNYSLMHAHLPLAGVVARLVGIMIPLPVIYTEHSLLSYYHPLTRILNRLTYGLNKKVVAVSTQVAISIDREVGSGWRKNGVVINNCIDLEGYDISGSLYRSNLLREEFGYENDNYIIGTVASIRHVKRIDLLVKAMVALRAKLPSSRLLIVGSGPELATLKNLVKELGLQEYVCFAGLRHDALDCLAVFDCYVICSDWEGLPLALIEAMTLARPIVATKVGGIPDLINHEVEGLLVMPGDVSALTNAILNMSRDQNRAKRMGDAAKLTITRKGDFNQAMHEYLKIYECVSVSS